MGYKLTEWSSTIALCDHKQWQWMYLKYSSIHEHHMYMQEQLHSFHRRKTRMLKRWSKWARSLCCSDSEKNSWMYWEPMYAWANWQHVVCFFSKVEISNVQNWSKTLFLQFTTGWTRAVLYTMLFWWCKVRKILQT